MAEDKNDLFFLFMDGFRMNNFVIVVVAVIAVAVIAVAVVASLKATKKTADRATWPNCRTVIPLVLFVYCCVLICYKALRLEGGCGSGGG